MSLPRDWTPPWTPGLRLERCSDCPDRTHRAHPADRVEARPRVVAVTLVGGRCADCRARKRAPQHAREERAVVDRAMARHEAPQLFDRAGSMS